MWSYLVDRFAVRTALDLGCGEGHAAAYLSKLGVNVIAIDGSTVNVRRQVYPILVHDITMMPVKCDVDLVWCQEVVEHIEEKHLSNLMASLSCGRIVVMTHAEPGQPGHHHVNCQPAEYWHEQMAMAGFTDFPMDTARVRLIADREGAYHVARSGTVYGRHSDDFRQGIR